MTFPVRLSAAIAGAALLSVCLFGTQAMAQATRPKSQPASRPARPVAGVPTQPVKVESDPKAIAVIDQYLEAIGGVASLKAIKERESHFVNRKFAATNVTPMTMVRFLKQNAKLETTMIREEWELPPMGLSNKPLNFVQVYNGVEGFVKAMGHVSPLVDRTLTVFVWDKPIDDHFMSWKDDGYTVKYKNTSDVDGAPCEVVETIAYAGKQRMSYFFSQKDGLLLKKEWTEPGQKGLMRKEVFYDQYTKIKFRDDPTKWIRFPINQKIFEDSELSLEKEFSKIVINGGISNSVFSRPDGPAFEDRPNAKPKTDPKKEDPKPTSQPKATSKPTSKPKG